MAGAAATAANGGGFVTFSFSRDAAAALRGFFAQSRWFGVRARLGPDGDAGTPVRLAAIKSLRVYEAYPLLDANDATGDEEETARDGEDAGDEAHASSSRPGELFALDDDDRVLRLAPTGTDPALLRRLDAIPSRARNRAMRRVLATLGSLTAADRGIADAIARAPFVPTRSGALAAPSSLYDPRIPELAALLDARSNFPTAPFDDASSLDALAGLGMRSGVTRAGGCGNSSGGSSAETETETETETAGTKTPPRRTKTPPETFLARRSSRVSRPSRGSQ